MRVAIVSGVSKKSDSFRGIGAHNSSLFEAFRKAKNDKIIDPSLSPNDDFSKFDAVHFTSFRPFFISLPYKKPKNTKFILTIHDLIPLIYPDHYKPGIKGRIKLLINKFLVKWNVDAIITISETSKKDICRFLGVKPEIVHVVYLAPKNAHFPVKDNKKLDSVKQKFNLPDKFVVYFGDIDYSKNIPTLLDACIKSHVKLVIIGKQASELETMDLDHPQNSHLKPILKDLLDNKKVMRLGFLSDEESNLILNLATVLVQPSFYEGFGFSSVHGFAAGCPVINAKNQALVEIGADAAIYFDPRSSIDLSEKINMFIKDSNLRGKYIKKGIARAKMYSWERTADQTMDVYEKVCNEK